MNNIPTLGAISIHDYVSITSDLIQQAVDFGNPNTLDDLRELVDDENISLQLAYARSQLKATYLLQSSQNEIILSGIGSRSSFLNELLNKIGIWMISF
jgi:hypothetical protein